MKQKAKKMEVVFRHHRSVVDLYYRHKQLADSKRFVRKRTGNGQ